MAGIMNKTARQFNLKCIDKAGHRVTVRIAPGFNVVDDAHWKPMANDPYVKSLKKDGSIDFGKAMDDKELEMDPDTKAKSKSTPPPQKSAAEKEADAKVIADAKKAEDDKEEDL